MEKNQPDPVSFVVKVQINVKIENVWWAISTICQKNICIKYKGIVFETYLHFVIAYNFLILLTYDIYEHSKAVSNKVKQNHMHTSVTNCTVLKLKSIKTLLVCLQPMVFFKYNGF